MSDLATAISKIDMQPVINGLTDFIEWAARTAQDALPGLIDKFNAFVRSVKEVKEFVSNGFDGDAASKAVGNSGMQN